MFVFEKYTDSEGTKNQAKSTPYEKRGGNNEHTVYFVTLVFRLCFSDRGGHITSTGAVLR